MRFAVSVAVLTFVMGLGGCRSQPVQATPPPPPPAAAVAALRDAKKVFVLNGGEENGFLGTYNYGQQTCYNEFYTALARTGNFQLVEDPADADLIAMIEGVQVSESVLDLHKRAPDTQDTIDYPARVVLYLAQRGAPDPPNQEPVYTISAVPSAAKKDPEKKLAIAETIAGFVTQMEVMAGAPVAPVSAADLLQSTAPVPNKVLTGKRIFVMADSDRQSDFMSGADWVEPFADDLRASNRYTVLPSAQGADLVLQLSFNRGLRVRILDGSTMKQLWTVDDPKFYYPGIGKKLKQNEAAGTASEFLKLTSTP
jgi:hypothetical protein